MNILKLKDLFNYKIALVIFKTLNLDQNSELSKTLTKFSEIHSHFTRNQEKYIVPKYNKKHSKFCIDHQGIVIWNSLPVDLKKITTINKFKKLLHHLYLSKYNV